MELAVLAQIGAVCVLGAMSPGPSLAVVLRNTVAGGRLRGVMTGLGHGIGFFLYALLADGTLCEPRPGWLEKV